MKFIKTYEEFRFKDEDEDTEVLEPEVELSDKTIDDVLSDDFFEDEDEGPFVDNKGVVNIKNWKIY